MLRLFVTVPVLESVEQKGDGSFDVSKEEVLTFIGINVATGIIRLQRVRDYWCTSPIFSLPWFPAIMSRVRFFKISSYLHLVDVTKQKKGGESGYDPLYKMHPYSIKHQKPLPSTTSQSESWP